MAHSIFPSQRVFYVECIPESITQPTPTPLVPNNILADLMFIEKKVQTYVVNLDPIVGVGVGEYLFIQF